MSEASLLAEQPEIGPAARPPRLALITGASAGIGRAFALRLAAEGYDLILVGRQLSRLEVLAALLPDVNVQLLEANLTTASGVELVASRCQSEPITLLVNAAGSTLPVPFSQIPAADAHALLQASVLATSLLTHAAIPGMIARGDGTIINLAGMLAFGAAAGPPAMLHQALHSAAQAHILALTQALSHELSAQGICLQALCPGEVTPDFHHQGEELSGIVQMSARDVVTASLHGLAMNEVVCAPGVERRELIKAIESASLDAFSSQKAQLAARYRSH